jgi:plastocyanin
MVGAVGRLVGIALAVAAAGIVVVLAVGPGDDRTEAGAPAGASAHATPPARQARAGAVAATGGTEARPPARVGAAGGTEARPPARVGATVRMRALAFSPARVTVRAGEVVRFVNDDDVDHSVEEDLGARSGVAAAFESARLRPGSSFRYTAAKPGSMRFVCTLHPTVMRGRILVLAS